MVLESILFGMGYFFYGKKLIYEGVTFIRIVYICFYLSDIIGKEIWYIVKE